jgi:ribosome-associated protein
MKRDDSDPGPTKSQRKRDMQDLQDLGEKLSRLRADQVRELPLEDGLIVAILAAQKMEPSEHRRRQMQLVGKLMRGEDVGLINAAYERATTVSQADLQALHDLEQWRARLLAEGDAAIGEALQAFPGAEASQLRQLIREARREAEKEKPPVSARKLFRYLKSLAPSSSA